MNVLVICDCRENCTVRGCVHACLHAAFTSCWTPCKESQECVPMEVVVVQDEQLLEDEKPIDKP